MRATPLFLCALLLFAGAAAAQNKFVTADAKLVDLEKAVVLCSPQQSRFRVHGVADQTSVDASFAQRFVVDYQAMMVMQAGFQFEDEPYRAWSRRAAFACGRYTIEVEAGFYNVNPNGRMGAEKDYPRVAISADDFRVAGWTSFAPCEYEKGEGLRDNVVAIEGRWLPADSQTELTRTLALCDTPGTKQVTSRAKTLKQLEHKRPGT